jgi:predicted ester cyclase
VSLADIAAFAHPSCDADGVWAGTAVSLYLTASASRFWVFVAAFVSRSPPFFGKAQQTDRLVSPPEAFPDFTPEIHWQKADGDVVTTYKTYHGTHLGNFLGVPGTGRKVSFETVDAMRVVDGRITEHWGVANLYSVMQQLGVLTPLP